MLYGFVPHCHPEEEIIVMLSSEEAISVMRMMLRMAYD